MAAPVTVPFGHSERSTVGHRVGGRPRRRRLRGPAAGRRGDPRGRPARRRRRAPADHPGAAAQHGRDPVGQVPHDRRGDGRPAAGARRGRVGGDAAAHPAHGRRDAPVRQLGAAEGHRQAAVRHAHRPDAVVGPADADLRRARARRHRGPRQGAAAVPGDAHGLRAHPVAVGVVAVLGRPGHRLRLEPRAALPAAADGRPAVRVRGLVPARAVRRRHDAHRGHRPVRRGPLGRPAVAAVRDPRDADRRRRLEPARGRGDLRPDPLLRRALLLDARPRRDPADAAAVVRAGEQVALGAVRHGRDHHHRTRPATRSW